MSGTYFALFLLMFILKLQILN